MTRIRPTGTAPAWAALLWAGLARVALLQHVTWSVNSLCHLSRRAAGPAGDPMVCWLVLGVR